MEQHNLLVEARHDDRRGGGSLVGGWVDVA
jgi:hypothetical protein